MGHPVIDGQKLNKSFLRHGIRVLVIETLDRAGQSWTHAPLMTRKHIFGTFCKLKLKTSLCHNIQGSASSQSSPYHHICQHLSNSGDLQGAEGCFLDGINTEFERLAV